MNIEKIKKANTKYIGKEIIYYEEVDSTQDEAKKMIESGIENGTIIIADNQTKGKGTKGRTWYSGKSKNIAMTIIIYTNCKIQKLDGLTVKIAQALVDSIRELYSIELSIKKPNDIILNNKKLSGILTEAKTCKNQVKHILIGIGFNVNETEFSRDTINIATSLKKEYGKEFCKEDIIIKCIEQFEKILIDKDIIK